MLRLERAQLFAIAVLATVTLSASPAAAQKSVADFYKGKTVSLLLGTGPGGSFAVYARIFVEYLGRHIPGNPSIVIEHMPGAGGVIAGNHLYGPAPQDGTKILQTHALPLSEMLQPKGVRFKSAEFQWLGTFDSIAHTMSWWHTTPVKKIADMNNPALIVGSFSKSNLTYQWPAMLKDVLGVNFKLITGYPSGSQNNLAMERGEIHGWAPTWENLIGTRPHWIAEKKVTILVQFTLERKKQLPNVPTLLELAPDNKKDVVEFLAAGTPFARAMAVGPRVPKDRVAALRKAFDATMRDPAVVAAAKKANIGLDPRDAAYAHALVNKVVNASPALIARVKKSSGQD
ncbi:MAG: Bug family tripartite tricarboxylate transporter substrate binding protein [Xanthobacteraceae bacterium]